jgi:hypothetical protein
MVDEVILHIFCDINMFEASPNKGHVNNLTFQRLAQAHGGRNLPKSRAPRRPAPGQAKPEAQLQAVSDSETAPRDQALSAPRGGFLDTAQPGPTLRAQAGPASSSAVSP